MSRETGRLRTALFVCRRFLAVAVAFGPLALSLLRDRRRFLLAGRSRDVEEATRERRARALHENLVALGPTFIKLGQLLSTRPDVLPRAYVDELSELQDRVPPADWDDAKAVLEADLGPVDETFDDFDTDPISGASLGQVYTATLDGERVAVKVRRPGVERRVEADLRVVDAVVPLMLRFSAPSQHFTLSNVAGEFARAIRAEMDYEHERATLDGVRESFAGDSAVRVPESVGSHSTARVLTMEYVDGTKIDDVDELDRMGVDRHALAERLERAYVRMILEDGVFHADPHPGNLAVREDGTVVLYDFGMTGSLSDERREQLREFYVAAASDDAEAMVEAFVAMGALDPAADREFVTEVMRLAVDHLRGDRLDEARVRDLVEAFEGTMRDVPFRMPQDLALVVRVSTVLEGVCLTLDPDFDFVEVVEAYVAERDLGPSMGEMAGLNVRDAVEGVGGDVAASARAAVRIPPKLDRALDRVDRDDLRVRTDVRDDDDVLRRLARRLVLGVAASAGVVTSALCYAGGRLDATAVAAVLTGCCLALLYRSFGSSSRRRAIQEAGQVAQRSFEHRNSRR